MQSVMARKDDGQGVLVDPDQTIVDMLKPFSPYDGGKGTFLTLLFGGLDQSDAIKAVHRKQRTLSLWRTTDRDFERIEGLTRHVPPTIVSQARVLRAGRLDISLIESANVLLERVIRGEPIPEASWGYLSRMASLRIPLMLEVGGAKQNDSWERLTRILTPIITQKEARVEKRLDGGTTLTLKESTVDMSKIGLDVLRDVLGGDGNNGDQV